MSSTQAQLSEQLRHLGVHEGAALLVAGVALAAKLHALGIEGQNPDRTSSTVMQIYDPNMNAWTRRAPVTLKVPAGPMSLVIRDGDLRIEMIGGLRPGNNLQYIPDLRLFAKLLLTSFDRVDRTAD